MELYNKTYDIMKSLPYWFSLRKKENADGLRLLNITGKEFNFIDSILKYAYGQCYINSVDLNATDIVYKIILPVIYNSNDIQKIYSSNTEVKITDSLSEFLGVHQDEYYYTDANPMDICYIDYTNNIIYFRNNYDADEENIYGKINIDIMIDKVKTKFVYTMHTHKIWNALDDYGHLLCETRYTWETNKYYINRIKDVFKNYANSSKEGFANGLARDLYLRHEEVWEDGSTDYIITRPMVLLNFIKVDGVKLPLDNVYISKEGNVILLKNDNYKNKRRIVSYISGLEIHQLFNKKDVKLMNELYNPDGTATNLLKYYCNLLQNRVPTFWGNFKWDEGYWNTSDEDVGSQGYIPNISDSKISGFKNYT